MIAALALAANMLGPLVPGTQNCYAVNERYAACLQYSAADDTLKRIVVLPAVYLGDGDTEFDRDDILTRAEYLVLRARLLKLRGLGAQIKQGWEFFTVSNNTYDDEETWQEGIISKDVSAVDESVIKFSILYFQRVTGTIDDSVEPECVPGYCEANDEDLFAGIAGCPETGPEEITIGGVRYEVALPDRRQFQRGEFVDVRAVAERTDDRPAQMYIDVRDGAKSHF